MTSYHPPSPDPLAPYRQPLITHMVIQHLVEDHLEEEKWNQLHTPAVPVETAAQIIPRLPATIDRVLSTHPITGKLHQRLMNELEDLASVIAMEIPAAQAKELADYAGRIAAESPNASRPQGPRYLIDIPDEQLDAAAHALAAAGIPFHHTTNLAWLSKEADLDHLCVTADLPDIIAALNRELELEESPRRFRVIPQLLSRRDTRSFMSIATELIAWSGSTPIDTGRIAEKGGLQHILTNYHPNLLDLLFPAE